MQFYNYVGPRAPMATSWTPVWTNLLPTSDEPEKVLQQCSLSSVFQSEFPGLTEVTLPKKYGFVTEDSPKVLNDLAKRYVQVSLAASGPYPALPTVDNHNLLTLILSPFLFIRGSMRFKFLAAATLTQGLISPYAVAQTVLGASVPASAGGIWLGSLWNKPLASVEVPFIQEQAFYELSRTIAGVPVSVPAYNLSFDPTTSAQYVWTSVGDDFSVGYQCAPPCMYFTTPLKSIPSLKQKKETV